MTLGKPAAAVASMPSRILARHSSWFSTRFSPLVIPWLGVMAQIRPCFRSVGHWSGDVSSMDLIPSRAQAAAKSSKLIFVRFVYEL